MIGRLKCRELYENFVNLLFNSGQKTDKMSRFSKTLRWCRRYISTTLVVSVAVIAFVLFFNDNSVMRTYEHEKEIERLQAEIRENRDTLRYYQQLNDRLDTDCETMEKIVREQYHMQRSGEDVYIFE